MFDVLSGQKWIAREVSLFKWTPAESLYLPNESSPNLSRFNDGSLRALYLAESPLGAMAEFFRRNPELLEFQENLKIRLFQLNIDVKQNALEVCTVASQDAVGISLVQLTSSDSDDQIRYALCRQLAVEVNDQKLSGITYPSAAATWADAWNLVLFGDRDSTNWNSNGFSIVQRPLLKSTHVRPISS